METPDARLARLAARQYGHYSTAQAASIGMTRRMLAARRAGGRVERAHRGVDRIAGAPRTWEGRALAAVLAVPDAVLSHRCAAHLWGFEDIGPPGIVDLTVDRHRRGDGHQGVKLHESKAFHLRDERVHKLIPVTGLARTVLDLCAVVDDDFEALRGLDHVVRLHLATWEELWRCLILHAARGRNGIARYRRILVKRSGRRVPDRRIAALLLDLIIDHDLPEPVSEHWVTAIARYRIDLAYPALKIAIECIGKEGHLNDASFEYDPIRRNRLELAGWIVLEVTWERLRDDPAGVLAEIRQAIKQRSGG